MTTDENEAIRQLSAAFQRNGWRDDGAVALRLVRAARHGDKDANTLRRAIPSSFLARNSAPAGEVAAVAMQVLEPIEFSPDVSPEVVLQMEEIDSFAAAASIETSRAAALAQPLALAEADVKRFIGLVIGEPYLDQDWGGELSDQLTARVVLNGRRVTAAFLLKGAGTVGELTPRRLGKNADQIRRLSKQVADIYVVQHVDKIAEATRDQLRDMVSAVRFREGRLAYASVWDGVDCAKLFLAHGLIDDLDARSE